MTTLRIVSLFNKDLRGMPFCRANDLEDLRGARFRRLVRLAHSEWLLSAVSCEDKFPAEDALWDFGGRQYCKWNFDFDDSLRKRILFRVCESH